MIDTLLKPDMTLLQPDMIQNISWNCSPTMCEFLWPLTSDDLITQLIERLSDLLDAPD